MKWKKFNSSNLNSKYSKFSEFLKSLFKRKINIFVTLSMMHGIIMRK